MSLAPQPRSRRPDPTVYPTEDDVGEEMIQRLICELLRPLLDRFLRERGVRAFVGADQFIYWRRGEPKTCVSPDVYVMPGVDPDLHGVKSWKVWKTRVVPSFALEVVADHRRKDYEESPARHAQLGTRELIVFDPHSHEGTGRSRWQVYRRRGRGSLRAVEWSDADRVVSRELGCYLREVGSGGSLRVRLGTGKRGTVLYPTAEERAEERAEAAETELAQVRAQLRRLSRRR